MFLSISTTVGVFCLFEFISCYKDVCYDDLGCFTDKPPFSSTSVRPLGVIPEPPEKVGTKFFLYTKISNNQTISSEFIPNSYNQNLPTKFIIHGFFQHGHKKWIMDMKNALLSIGNMNIIVVDYSKGSGFPYTQAVANAQIAGSETAKLIKSLVEKTGAKISDFHLIGHSLGAHVAGYAGERLNGLGRITGLDPAGPYFEFAHPKVRLDPTDAKFVDVIHTDGISNLKLGLGMLEPSGHVDFYPNGGFDQVNCGTLPDKIVTGLFNIVTFNLNNLEDISGCSHVAAYKLFTDTIINKECKYTAYKCSSKKEFDAGNCVICSERGCNRMGYWASASNELGRLFLNTQDTNDVPFCLHNYQVRLHSNNLPSQTIAKGKFSISFKNSQQSSNELVLDNLSISFKPNEFNTHLISLNISLNGEISSISVKYEKTNNIFDSWYYDNAWSFKFIEIFDGDYQLKLKFCPKQQIISSGGSVEFISC